MPWLGDATSFLECLSDTVQSHLQNERASICPLWKCENWSSFRTHGRIVWRLWWKADDLKYGEDENFEEYIILLGRWQRWKGLKNYWKLFSFVTKKEQKLHKLLEFLTLFSVSNIGFRNIFVVCSHVTNYWRLAWVTSRCMQRQDILLSNAILCLIMNFKNAFVWCPH